MTDDSLDDVNRGKSVGNNGKKFDIEQLVVNQYSVYAREVWNAAIEAAARVAVLERHNMEMSDKIRELKK